MIFNYGIELEQLVKITESNTIAPIIGLIFSISFELKFCYHS
jgi:hypothetical protein